MWLITYDSEHYTWQACGSTREEAEDAFKRLLRGQGTAEFRRWAMQDAKRRELLPGCGWRDDYQLVSPRKRVRAKQR